MKQAPPQVHQTPDVEEDTSPDVQPEGVLDLAILDLVASSMLPGDAIVMGVAAQMIEYSNSCAYVGSHRGRSCI